MNFFFPVDRDKGKCDQRKERRRPCDHRVRDGSNGATSQGMPATTRAGRDRNRLLLLALRLRLHPGHTVRRRLIKPHVDKGQLY